MNSSNPESRNQLFGSTDEPFVDVYNKKNSHNLVNVYKVNNVQQIQTKPKIAAKKDYPFAHEIKKKVFIEAAIEETPEKNNFIENTILTQHFTKFTLPKKKKRKIRAEAFFITLLIALNVFSLINQNKLYKIEVNQAKTLTTLSNKFQKLAQAYSSSAVKEKIVYIFQPNNNVVSTNTKKQKLSQKTKKVLTTQKKELQQNTLLEPNTSFSKEEAEINKDIYQENTPRKDPRYKVISLPSSNLINKLKASKAKILLPDESTLIKPQKAISTENNIQGQGDYSFTELFADSANLYKTRKEINK
jgi:hypothetical protein